MKGLTGTRAIRLCSLRFVHCTMEVILDELRKNNVDIDMTTLSYHIHQCLEQYKTMYEQMTVLPVNLPEIFAETKVNSFGIRRRNA